jgi:hypothetical protein
LHIACGVVAAVSVVGLTAFPETSSAEPVGPGAIVVNEIASGAYVELRNVTQSTVDMSGFNLWLCGANEVVGRARLAVGHHLNPGGFYLFASSSFTGAAADQVYAGALPSGGVMLLDASYGWVDGVAVVADSPCGAGIPAPACPLSATGRDAESTNTRDNSRDFACQMSTPSEPN